MRVKPGVAHDQYRDIPLGGWVGKIKRIGWLTPICYAIHWTKPTLEQAHPVFFKRCHRDEMKRNKHWLDEDQLEEVADPTPVAMELPTNIVTRPLSTDDPDDRIRRVFGLTGDDGLPKADEQRQRHFFGHLKTRLSFPFKTDYWPASALGSNKSGKVEVLGFADPPLDCREGIVCEARKGKNEFQVPLVGLQLGKADPNYQYVEDYTYWLWEVQDFEQEDDVAESPKGKQESGAGE